MGSDDCPKQPLKSDRKFGADFLIKIVDNQLMKISTVSIVKAEFQNDLISYAQTFEKRAE